MDSIEVNKALTKAIFNMLIEEGFDCLEASAMISRAITVVDTNSELADMFELL